VNHTLTLARRHAAKALIVLLFSIPLLAMLVMKDAGTGENRNLAALPATPHGWRDTLAYPGQIDLWLNDHLGLRKQLIELNNLVRFKLFKQFQTHQLILGHHGRVFLSAYNPAEAPYSGIQSICGYGIGADTVTAVVNHINLFNRTMREQRLGGRLMIVPSAPMVYAEDLPDWLRARCASTTAPIQRVMASPLLQQPELVLYPLAELRAIRANAAVFPSTYFHWAGAGARLGAELSMQRFWPGQGVEAPPLRTGTEAHASDVAHMFPGVKLDSRVETADLAASGVTACSGAPCYPEMAAVASKLWGINRYGNPAAPLPRLVLITDSFGIALGPWYARYYRDVLQISTNDFGQLSPAEVVRLKAVLFQRESPQHLLFVYHDGTVQGGGRIEADINVLFPPK
jgi:hypothetical protein